jgi:hypothetical protein
MCKILLSDTPGNIQKNIANLINNELIFYDRSLDDIEILQIQILDPVGKILSVTSEFSLTLEIQESIEVLKETLIDSTTNQVFTTGYKEN